MRSFTIWTCSFAIVVGLLTRIVTEALAPNVQQQRRAFLSRSVATVLSTTVGAALVTPSDPARAALDDIAMPSTQEQKNVDEVSYKIANYDMDCDIP
jgi:lipopolysaccharide export LptBFGC system permease protein LptF